MLIYLIFLMLSLALVAQAMASLFRDRFPHPVDVATISIAYYGIPLSLSGYFDWNFDGLAFLAPFAADQGLAAMAIRFIFLALVALQAGRWLGIWQGPSRFTRFGSADLIAGERVRFALLALIALAAMGIYLFGLTEFLSGYATDAIADTGLTGNALVFITLELMGLAIGYAMIIGQSTGRTPAKTLIALCIVIFVAILAIRAKRLEIVAALLPPLLVFISRRQSLSSLTWRIVAGALGVLVLLTVSFLRVSDTFSAKQSLFLILSEGLYAGHSMPGILERLETSSLAYEYGSRYISALFGFVPRFLWEGKDDLVYAGNIALQGVSPQGATNMLAEVVLQGGIVAVALAFAAMGFVFERIARFRDVWDEALAEGKIPARVGAYLIVIAVFIPHFRDGIIPAIKLSLQAGVFFVAMSGMRLIARPTFVLTSSPKTKRVRNSTQKLAPAG